MLQEPQFITIQKTARYYLSGPLSHNFKHVCFVLHGYGQLVPYFICHFEELQREDTLFIAPEGLHRFYLEGSRGRVGASWMTKEDRLNDIKDYCSYLDQLYSHFSETINGAETVGLFAFSQGVATACRWLTATTRHFDYLINYAGAFPPDLDHKAAISKMKNLPVHMLVGDEDEYISLEKFEDHLAEIRSLGFEVKSQTFEGKHKLYQPVLKGLFDELLDQRS